MFNLNKFISNYMIHRPVSMFESDMQANFTRIFCKEKGLFSCHFFFPKVCSLIEE